MSVVIWWTGGQLQDPYARGCGYRRNRVRGLCDGLAVAAAASTAEL